MCFNVLTCVCLQVALHACGVVTDMVVEQCIQAGATFVVSPCCYGFVQNTLRFTFPRRSVSLSVSMYVFLPVSLSQCMSFCLSVCHCLSVCLRCLYLVPPYPSSSVIFIDCISHHFCLSLSLSLTPPVSPSSFVPLCLLLYLRWSLAYVFFHSIYDFCVTLLSHSVHSISIRRMIFQYRAAVTKWQSKKTTA